MCKLIAFILLVNAFFNLLFCFWIFQLDISQSIFLQGQAALLLYGKVPLAVVLTLTIGHWSAIQYTKPVLFSYPTTESLKHLGNLIQHLCYCFRIPPPRTHFLQVMKNTLKRERAFKFWGTALREICNKWLLRILSLELKFCSCILWQELKGWQRDGRMLSIKCLSNYSLKRSLQWQLFF